MPADIFKGIVPETQHRERLAEQVDILFEGALELNVGSRFAAGDGDRIVRKGSGKPEGGDAALNGHLRVGCKFQAGCGIAADFSQGGVDTALLIQYIGGAIDRQLPDLKFAVIVHRHAVLIPRKGDRFGRSVVCDLAVRPDILRRTDGGVRSGGRRPPETGGSSISTAGSTSAAQATTETIRISSARFFRINCRNFSIIRRITSLSCSAAALKAATISGRQYASARYRW